MSAAHRLHHAASMLFRVKLLLLFAPLVTLAGPTAIAKEPTFAVDCAAPAHRIDPRIYGVAYYPLTDAQDGYVWGLRPGARRWGGNHTSRYNWRLGNAWNTASDWFFRNVNYTGRADFSWRTFLDDNAKRGVGTALTIPMLGWVAKDIGSASYPKAVYGAQAQSDPHHPDAGNGMTMDGREIIASPSRTSRPMPPSEVEAWVRAIRAYDKARGRRSVDYYLLDNEPTLWSTTHRDVHPEPVGYDELFERTVAYASAIRRADPDAVIAGPAVWGWPAYFFSGIDAKAGFFSKPDRRAHGDVPLLAWYLRKVRAHEKKTGVRLVDVLDVHYYPQEISRDADDPTTRGRRLRATRSLWDPSYKDESWIDDTVELLPRLRKLVAENAPGMKLMIGEYNFGGERNMTGALALAEVLGRFSQEPTLTAAFYFTYPPAGSPAYEAFRAFRDYDGHGSGFLERSLPTQAPSDASLFASTDATKQKVVMVLTNTREGDERTANVHLGRCGVPTSTRAFRYAEGMPALSAMHGVKLEPTGMRLQLPPRSITVVELTMPQVAGR